jgi:hypothetical protein
VGGFDFLKSKDKQFVTEKSFQSNLHTQVTLLPKTLEELRKHNVNETDKRKLEFFFYTNTSEKAKLLTDELQKKEYSVEYKISAYDKKSFVITGWTSKITVEENALTAWAKEMCEVGYKYDCEFDGWGTDIDQKDDA